MLELLLWWLPGFDQGSATVATARSVRVTAFAMSTRVSATFTMTP